MSDTPRTDAEEIPFHAIKLPHFPNGKLDVSCKWVSSSFARTLEREVAASNRELVEWERRYDQLKQQLKEEKNHSLSLIEERDKDSRPS